MSTDQWLDEFENLVNEIRDVVEYREFREIHFNANEDNYNRFCVALDTLEDTILATHNYCQSGLGGSEGESYLRLYGLFQAIFLQQDCLQSLWSVSFDREIPVPNQDSAWKIIREIRNYATGHPIQVTRSGAVARTFVSRAHLKEGRLYLIQFERTSGETSQNEYDIESLVSNYLQEAIPLLHQLLKIVQNRFSAPPET